jgi:hypothetical protein
MREMTEAGYRLTDTHDVVRGYWFGLFEVAAVEDSPLTIRREPAR